MNAINFFIIEKKTACTPSPCLNNGHCFTDGTDAFECVCRAGTKGKLCESKFLVTLLVT